jgi:hypothetical protein
VPPEGCAAVYEHLRTIDPDHPVAVIEAPRGPAPAAGERDTPLTAAAVAPYAAACDIHGVDIYPVSKPPGAHAGGPPVNTDMQARLMVYDAVIAGARGLFFFGGHLTQVMTPADRELGWNWAYWDRVQRPLVVELTDAAHTRALTAPLDRNQVRSSDSDVAVSTREAGGTLYVIAARRSASSSKTPTRFTGLPSVSGDGLVLAHPGNPARQVHASAGAFTDPSPFGAHNARVYGFGSS